MSFQIALSGLDASRTDLEVTSNNIANSRTTGFKEARTEFGDVFATSINDASSTAPGRGVRVNRIAQQFSQGTVDFTSRNLDLAINGDGFFVLKEEGGGVSYTRAGAFSADKDGYIVDHKGQRLQTYPAQTIDGETSFTTGVLQDLQLPLANSAPNATGEVYTAVNLDAAARGPSLSFASDNASSYNYSTSSTIYDSLGASHTATFYYDKHEAIRIAPTLSILDATVPATDNTLGQALTVLDQDGLSQPASLSFTNQVAPGVWAVELTVNGSASGSPQTISFGTDSASANISPELLNFSINGATYSVDLSGATQVVTGTSTAEFSNALDNAGPDNAWEVYTFIDGVDFTGANNTLYFTSSGALSTPPDGILTANAYTPPGSAPIVLEIDVTDMTQFGGDFAVSNITQDGYATGRLSGLDIDSEGVAFARYTNGQATALGKVALAKFNSPQNLTKLGDTSWAESFASGQALLGEATTSSFGAIQSGALEASNVDLAEQLVNLIVAQRSFQANSKVITSNDQILQTIIQI